MLVSHVRLLVIPWTVARQALLSMGLSRQEYWSGEPLPSPGDLSHPGVKPGSPALPAESLPSEPPGKPMQCLPQCIVTYLYEVPIFDNTKPTWSRFIFSGRGMDLVEEFRWWMDLGVMVADFWAFPGGHCLHTDKSVPPGMPGFIFPNMISKLLQVLHSSSFELIFSPHNYIFHEFELLLLFLHHKFC